MAIVHEWVDAYAGSEQVFEAIACTYPDADLFALSREPSVTLEVDGRQLKTTFLDRPALRKRRAMTLPLMPMAFRLLGKSRFELVVSSHHAFAQTNRLADGGIHLCYVHSPARYLWSPDIDERGAAWYLRPARAALRKVDLAASRRVAAYAANSAAVAQRIQEFWGREATVIHPPVRVEYFGESSTVPPSRDYVLGVGRWIPYKNLHLVIEAADICGLPVKIAGRGPDGSRMQAAAAAAKVPVEFIESPTNEQLRDLYRNAACLVFPTVEDFGMVPVEAQAAGTPIVALNAGGARETVRHEYSGLLVETADPVQLAAAIKRAHTIEPSSCAENAKHFSAQIFQSSFQEWVRSQTAVPGRVRS